VKYDEALSWLYGTQLFGIKLGLDSIRDLLGRWEFRRPAQRIIHVAGTNGKGSTCAMIESVARAQGYRTGSSPPLTSSPFANAFRCAAR
jgi:dihydrofolate synthase/folylpolyglutamate synthase